MYSNGEAYERFMGRWSRPLALLLLEFADIPDGGRVLDLGAGAGSLAFTIAEKRPHCSITGIDDSPEYVAHVKRRNLMGDRVRFEVGDAQQMRFDDATFQSTLSLLVFNFIPDPEKALCEAARVTQPGGRIAAAVWEYGAGMEMLRVFWDAAASIDPRVESLDEKHMPLCRAGELAQLWTKVGLTNVAEKPLDITMRFQNFADYWEPFLLGQGPAGAYARQLEQPQLKQVREEVKRRLQLSQENTAFELSGRAWGVRGTV